MESSESSTAEPVAVRRRVDLDASFTGTVGYRHGQQSPVPNDVLSIGSADFENVVAGDSNTSKVETVGDIRQKTSVPSNASGESGHGELEKDDVVSETSENRKRSGNIRQADNAESSENEPSQSSDSDKDSGSVGHNLPSSFGWPSSSLVELMEAYERVSDVFYKEKERVDNVFTAIAEDLTKVSQLTFRFYTIATVPVGEVVRRTENCDLEMSDICSDKFEERLDVIKAYVSRVRTEGHWNQTGTENRNLIEDDNSDGDQGKHETHLNVLYSCSLEKAVMSAKKSLNVVVRQWNVMSNLCGIAERYIFKTEISCKLILNCLTSIVTMVAPTQVTWKLIIVMLATLDGEGQSVPTLWDAAFTTYWWTNEALLYAESAMDLHRQACSALDVSRWDLDVMRGYERRGRSVLVDVTTSGIHFLDLLRQSNISLAKIKNRKLHMKTMRHLLIPDVTDTRYFGHLIEQWSAVCSDTVSTVLQTLSLATGSSCNAIAAAIKAVEDILFLPTFSQGKFNLSL